MIIIFGDNQGVITFVKNLEFYIYSKYINIRYYFVREKVVEGTIDLQYILIKYQVVDGLTKPLLKNKFIKFQNALGFEYVALVNIQLRIYRSKALIGVLQSRSSIWICLQSLQEYLQSRNIKFYIYIFYILTDRLLISNQQVQVRY